MRLTDVMDLETKQRILARVLWGVRNGSGVELHGCHPSLVEACLAHVEAHDGPEAVAKIKTFPAVTQSQRKIAN